MKRILLLLVCIAATAASAQRLSHLWTGLRQPQTAAEMPISKAPYQTAKRIPKAPPQRPASLQPVSASEWILAQGWEMIDAVALVEQGQSIFDPNLNTQNWYDAAVPGTALTTLVQQGAYPDPFYGLNNLAIPDSLSRIEWWYRCVFDMPEGAAAQQFLLFNGINYRADIYLNGKRIGSTKGAFLRSEFNIAAVAKPKGNILAVHVFPPYNAGIPHEQSIQNGQGLNGGALSMDGPTFISSVGWDWIPGIRDRKTGIWQDVRLRTGSAVRIGDPLIVTDLPLPDTTQAFVTIEIPLRNTSAQPQSGILTIAINPSTTSSTSQAKKDAGKGTSKDAGKIELPYSLQPHGESTLVYTFNVKQPRLWWPNGYGAQNLYNLDLSATIMDNGQWIMDNGNSGSAGRAVAVSDSKTLSFGIREMSYELMISKDSVNHRVLYTPNAARRPNMPNTPLLGSGRKPVFNYEQRVHYSKDIQLPTLAADAADISSLSTLEPLPADDPVGAYLVVRVNGVRIFCRGGNWGMDDGMKQASHSRMEAFLKLHKDAGFNIIRNWTGESTQEDFYAMCDKYGMLVWNDFWITTDDTVEPSDFDLFMGNATDVVRRFRHHPCIALWCPRNEGFAPKGLSERLAAMLAAEDPTRHYHGQSRFLNMGTSGPWNYFKDPSLYYTRNAQGFDTEMGSFAIPTAATIRKFIAPEDQWPINDVWAYHDMHHTSQGFADFMEAVERYGKPSGLDDFAKKAQFITYDAWRNMLEAWNSRMWNTTTGLILWMSHPAWYSMIWQTYTYDLETPGSYFGAKKACEPLHIQMNLPNRDIMVVNTTRSAYSGLTAEVILYDMRGKTLYGKAVKVNVGANAAAVVEALSGVLPQDIPKLCMARLVLKDGKGNRLSLNDYWLTDGAADAYQEMNALPVATYKITPKDVVEKRTAARLQMPVEIVNTSAHIMPAVKLNVVSSATGEILLPAYFSDGYFNLLPGEKRVVMLEPPLGVAFKVAAAGYNVQQ
jgi:hypothetical protein